MRSLEENIKISIVVPIYCTPEKYLCEMIESVQNQSYPHWELCLKLMVVLMNMHTR